MLADKLTARLNKGAGRIVWAFDPKYEEKDPFSKFKKIFNDIQENIAAVKINRQLILPYGLKNKEIRDLITLVHEADIPLIMDAKVNDIGYTNESIARNYFEADFDALICNPFIGKDGLEPILSVARDFHKDVIFLTYMSHASANFGYGREIILTAEEQEKLGKQTAYYYELFAHLVNDLNAAGSIAGAIYPEKIKEIRTILKPDKLIFSPGVGAQSGDAKKSREMGLDYAIVGRAITEGKDIKQYCQQLAEDLK